MIHDYTQLRWGHSYTVMQRDRAKGRGHVIGWGTGIKEGDTLVLPTASGTVTLSVERISYFADPPDMWNAELVCPTVTGEDDAT